MTLVTYSNNLVRQRALQDFHTLAQLDPQNGQILLEHPKFHSWLLELLMPYQDFTAVHSVLSESSRAVYDMGCKLHTLLLRNACTNPEEDGNKRINLLTRWPAMILDQVGLVDVDTNIRTLRDFDTANGICRVLITQLLGSLRDETKNFRSGFKVNNSVHRNLIHITT